MRKPMIAAMVLTGCLVLTASAVQAAELRVLASNGIKAAMEALKPQFERPGGDTLSFDFSTTATLREQIEKGAPFDVAILTDDVVDALIKSGTLVASTRTELARVGIGVGFRKGAAKPDIRTAASLKQALLSAKSIAYTGNGATRPYIDKMFATLGITSQMQAKTHLTVAGQAPASVGKGESEIVITLISEILPEPGVELAGPLPSDFQSYLVFAAATGTKSGKAQASKALIAFLAGSSSSATYKAAGMQR